MPCIKAVGGLNCQYCNNKTIKFGKPRGIQRYRCNKCRKIQLAGYKRRAYQPWVDNYIANHIKEGCGIRSIARLLGISAGTVLKRIRKIADTIQKPLITVAGGIYEVDELRTYIGKRDEECWVIYTIDKASGQVLNFEVGRRTKINLSRITDLLILSGCKRIYTDGLNIYRYLIPAAIHRVKRYGTNKIERKNLSLRTHLKRLGRKTICFSKSITMLEACLKIYFWLV